ncbi:MAG: class I SAM-dependent methyltransferase [Halodesulfurarchaeum sp.]
MSIREAFDEWARTGRDRGMEERHWHTAKEALSMLPVEAGETVLDLGTGSGYALRALRERSIGRGYGVDASPEMLGNARSYTDDGAISYLLADFEALPLSANTVDHAFSMEAIYYADVPRALAELHRVVRPGGTVFLAVNYYAENPHTEDWDTFIDVPLARLSREEYRKSLRGAGFHVGTQYTIPDREVEIPPESAFPTEDFDSRADMVEHYRTYGTLVTVGVVP